MNNKNIVIITDCISVALTVTILVFVFVIHSKLSHLDYDYLKDIGINWNKGPIEAFTQSDSSTSICPGKSEYLIKEYWAGTNIGCRCPNTTTLHNLANNNSTKTTSKAEEYSITPYSCFSNKFYSKQCTIIPPRPQQRYKGWRNLALCGIRSKLTYFDLPLANSKQNCTGKICGVADSKHNYLCLPENKECPINSVKIQSSSSSNSNNNKVYTINLKNKILTFTNDNTANAIVNQLKVSENQPCSDLDYVENSLHYILDIHYKKDNCKESKIKPNYDPRFIEIDSYKYMDLMKDNNLIPSIIGLPNINKELLYQKEMKLFYRNYIGLSPECRAKFLKKYPFHNDLLHNFIHIDDYVKNRFNPRIVKYVAFTFIVVIIVFLLIKLSLSRWYYDTKLQIASFRKFINFILVYFYIAFVLLCILFLAQLCQFSHIYYWLIEDKNCTDDITFQLITKFHSKVSNSIWFVTGIFIISLLLLGLIFMEYYLKCCREEEEKQEIINEENENNSLYDKDYEENEAKGNDKDDKDVKGDSSFIMKEKNI